ncbi:RagB/SusD family nutrient uptake outer membrane protein [Flavobacterium sp. PL002]|uniref:RagB/SusD family nutrient uptake outer membrane protein n=1 Tax=Flavobacterium sp. PL002 TaxID=1897058 RepID=UPI001787AF49|nr:RagB/SusD family nutrient uptake outer membrane protein [Flavobacterium sp. PL002]MBE0392828.1 hypothetical protein [Flavobacterium sp. PL002]
MKKSINKYIALIFTAGLIVSCSPDLTETNPNFTDASSFWKDLDDTNSGLTAAYATLLSPYTFNLREEMVRSDMGYFSNVRPTPFASNDLAYTFWFQNYTNNNQSIDRHWAACYRGIFRANQVIEALEKIKPQVTDTDKWTYQMAQARFLRGLFHFYLHTSFNEGRVVIEDHTPITNEDFFKTVSSSADVIAFFRKDLMYAYDNLPATPTAEKARASKAAAATVLGMSHLYQGENDLAIPYFKNVIDNPAYKLFGLTASQDPITMFYTANEFNSESIFEVNFDGNFRPELGLFDEESTTTRNAFLSFSQNLLFSAPAWVAYAYKSEPMDVKDVRNHKGGALSNPLRSVPLRASAMVILPDDLDTPTYGQPAAIDVLTAGLTLSAANPTAQARVFAYYKKYLNVDIYTGEAGNPLGAQKSSKNFIVHRLSEVYLMQAECLIKTGDINGALALINKVRARWGLVLLGTSGEFSGARTYNGVSYTAKTLLDQLMFVDKALETAAEGHATRFADLRRWGILKNRFDDLAAKTFYLNDFTYQKTTNPNIGTPNTKFKAIVVDDVAKVIVRPSNDNLANHTVPNEFTIPAQNFQVGVSEYLPLPSNEVGRNPNLNN